MTAVGTAAQQPGVSVVSMSWGHRRVRCWPRTKANYDHYLTTPAGHQGVTFVASTGDYGRRPEYPAFSPNVLAVGGTTLFLNSNNSYSTENGWGGFSRFRRRLCRKRWLCQRASIRLSRLSSSASNPLASAPHLMFPWSPTLPPERGSPIPRTRLPTLLGKLWAAQVFRLPAGRDFMAAGQLGSGVAAGASTLNSASPTDTQQALYGMPQRNFQPDHHRQ